MTRKRNDGTQNSIAKLVLLRGVLGEVHERDTSMGPVTESSLRTVSTIADQRVRDDVPLVWLGSPGSCHLVVGHEVVISGRVRQRFFRSNGVTVSRTGVIVEDVALVSHRAAARRLTERIGMRASALLVQPLAS